MQPNINPKKLAMLAEQEEGTFFSQGKAAAGAKELQVNSLNKETGEIEFVFEGQLNRINAKKWKKTDRVRFPKGVRLEVKLTKTPKGEITAVTLEKSKTTKPGKQRNIVVSQSISLVPQTPPEPVQAQIVTPLEPTV